MILLDNHMNILSIDNIANLTYAKNININNIRPSRAGVIAYTVYKKKTYFILGIDTKSGDITDFGGGISLKREDALQGGLREFSEETLGIFGKITVDEIKNSLVIYDDKNLIIFIHLSFDICEKYFEFQKRVKQCEKPEVIDLKFLDKKAFLSLINGNNVDGSVLYDRIRTVLSNTKSKVNFFNLL